MTDIIDRILEKFPRMHPFRRFVTWLRNNLLLVFFICFTSLVMWTYWRLDKTDDSIQRSRIERVELARDSDLALCRANNRQERRRYAVDREFWTNVKESTEDSIKIQQTLDIPGLTPEVLERLADRSRRNVAKLKPDPPVIQKCSKLPITKPLDDE